MTNKAAFLIAGAMFVLGTAAGSGMSGMMGKFTGASATGGGLSCDVIAAAITSANLTEQQRSALVEKLAQSMNVQMPADGTAVEKFKRVCGKGK